MWNLKRNDTNELTYKTETNSQTYENELMAAGEWEGTEGKDS